MKLEINNYLKEKLWDEKFLTNKIKFIDLFAGIGGFRLALENTGHYECVFSCENDPHAIEMYRVNYNDNPSCDMTKLDANIIPEFDMLCAGFPCQSFSASGKLKGFNDTRGTLFFDICRIVEKRKPKLILLENVKNLIYHDHGKTFEVIYNSLKNLGYTISYKVLNARDFGVPQNRERIIIIANRDNREFSFEDMKTNTVNSMMDFLDKRGRFEYLDPSEYEIIENPKTQKSGLIFTGYRKKKLRQNGVRPNTQHLSRAHKQPNRIYSSKGVHPTISSNETSGRYFIYHENKVRKLTINECYRFFGFPENFKKVGSKTKLYARIGNSVCVNMIEEIGNQIYKQQLLC